MPQSTKITIKNTTTFETAFELFKENGYFELNYSSLHLGQLHKIQAYLSDESNPKIPYSQFHLNNVYLIPDNILESEITGAIKEHEHVIRKNDNHNNHVDAHLIRMLLDSSNKFNLQLPIINQSASNANQSQDFNNQKSHFEMALVDLLTLPWSDIKLNGAYFSNKNKDFPLSSNFTHKLLNFLEKNGKIIKKLSLGALDYDQNILIKTLAGASGLEFLGLKINWPHVGIAGLLYALIKHPTLISLDLRDIPITQRDCRRLAALITYNYRIKEILFEKPVGDNFIEEVYEWIISRLKGNREEQFTLEQLNENKWVNLAEKAIRSENLDCLQVVLNFQLDLGVITASDKNALWVDNACRQLPEVYQHHPEYLQKFSALVGIVLSNFYKETNKTIGYHLLEIAFEVRNARSIKLLLQAGANILETLDGRAILFKQLFDGNKRQAWKEDVIEHIQKNLTTLAPQLSKLRQVDEYIGQLKNREIEPIYNIVDLITAVITAMGANEEEKKEQFKIVKLKNNFFQKQTNSQGVVNQPCVKITQEETANSILQEFRVSKR